jgi:serine/threonine protein kinase
MAVLLPSKSASPDVSVDGDSRGSRPPADSNSQRLEIIEGIIADVILRRGNGENLSDKDVVSAHASLMPELAQELNTLHLIHSVVVASERPPNEIASSLPHRLAISGYRILSEVSSGGQATVYRGIKESTGRIVAIKILHGGPFIGSRQRARYERETESLAKLTHPNIVQIIDRGRTADGSFFLVMDFIEGCGLDAYLYDHTGDLKLMAALFVKISRALDEAHRNAVIHRDLKPMNILVDHRGEPHIVDFGLAYLRDEGIADDASASRLTRFGQAFGSLPWCSPEQVIGNLDQIDGRSDVYSLGVMLYEVFTGNYPYPVSEGFAATAQHIQKTQPLALNKNLAAGHEKVASDLEAIVLRALSKDPGERYQSAADLANDLNAFLNGKPLKVTKVRPRSTAKAIVLCIVIFILIGIWLPGVSQWSGESRRPEVLPLHFFTNSIGMRLVQLPQGKISIGAATSQLGTAGWEPARFIAVSSDLSMATTPITVGEYKAVTGIDVTGIGEGSDFPAHHISYADAMQFCAKLSAREGRHYRLPTEEEWEYGFLAGRTGTYGGDENVDDMAWYHGNSGDHHHPIATKFANAWGLFDMAGEVRQWCSDKQAISLEVTQDGSLRPNATKIYRIAKGASISDAASQCAVTSRFLLDEDLRSKDVGFRIVCDGEPATRP